MSTLGTLFKAGLAGTGIMAAGGIAAANTQNLTKAAEVISVSGSKVIKAVSVLPNYISPSIKDAVGTALQSCSDFYSRGVSLFTGQAPYIPAYVSEKGLTVYQGAVGPVASAHTKFLPALPLVVTVVRAAWNSFSRSSETTKRQTENNALICQLATDQDSKKCADLATERQSDLLAEAHQYKELSDRKISLTSTLVTCAITTAALIFVPEISIKTLATVTVATEVTRFISHYWNKSGNRNMAEALEEEARLFGKMAKESQNKLELKEKNGQLVKEKEDLENRNGYLGREYGQLKEQNLITEGEKEKLEQQKIALSEELQKEKDLIKAAKDQCNALETEVKDLQKEKAEIEAELKTVSEDLAIQHRDTAEINKLNRALDKVNLDLQQKIKEVQIANEEYKAANTQAVEKVAELERDNEDLASERERLTEHVHGITIVLKEHEDNLKHTRQELADSDTKLKETTTKCAELENEAVKYKQERDEHLSEMDHLHTKNALLSSEVQALNKDIKDLDQKNDEIYNKLWTSECTYEQQAESLKETIENQNRRILDLEKENKTLDNYVTHLKGTIATSNENIEKLKSSTQKTIDALKVENKMLLLEANKFKKSFEDESAQHDERVRQLREDIALLSEEKKILEGANTRANQRYDVLVRENAQMKRSHKDTKKELKKLKQASSKTAAASHSAQKAVTEQPIAQGALKGSCKPQSWWGVGSYLLATEL